MINSVKLNNEQRTHEIMAKWMSYDGHVQVPMWMCTCAVGLVRTFWIFPIFLIAIELFGNWSSKLHTTWRDFFYVILVGFCQTWDALQQVLLYLWCSHRTLSTGRLPHPGISKLRWNRIQCECSALLDIVASLCCSFACNSMCKYT